MGSKKGKLKISKFEGNKKLKCVEENSELTSFCDSLKRNTTLKDRVLKTNTVTEMNMRRLSLVCDEIEKFEREFVEPVRISASSLSLAATLDRARPRNNMKKHHSANLLPAPEESSSRLNEMNKYFSSDSVASGYDSGAFSRESTPDLSLASSLDTPPCGASPSITGDCENNVVQTSSPQTDDQSSIGSRAHCQPSGALAFLSSTPRKPLRSQSERLPQKQVTSVRRSHTTVYGDSESSAHSRVPARVSRAGCSDDCRSKVTVNGFCYH